MGLNSHAHYWLYNDLVSKGLSFLVIKPAFLMVCPLNNLPSNYLHPPRPHDVSSLKQPEGDGPTTWHTDGFAQKVLTRDPSLSQNSVACLQSRISFVKRADLQSHEMEGDVPVR